MEEKCKPGHCYRKRLEPVLLRRLDLRSKRYAITERGEKVQVRDRKEGSYKGENNAKKKKKDI